MGRRLLIVGAGPVGLEAALAAVESGWDVTLVERETIGANVLRWGHVRFFSPWSMNTSPRGRAVAFGGAAAPDDAVCPTGREYVELYLEPIGARIRSVARALEQTEVLRVGRAGVLKTEAIGAAARRGRSFSALVRSADGGESLLEADAIIDASGTYGNPNDLGPGGLPVPGEGAVRDRITWVIPDVLGVDRALFAGRRTLVVGSGFSAATTLSLLLVLAESAPGTEVVWVTREGRAPYPRIDGDALPDRDALAALGNELTAGTAGVEWLGGYDVVGLADVAGRVGVRLAAADGNERREVVDQIVANVGYRPDTALHRELQVHQCYASEGPMKLAVSLLAADGADCLAQPAAGADALENPEPDFFVVGSKSYGRNSQFLLRVGLEQVDAVLGRLGPP